MTITNKITIDMAKPGVPPTVHAVQSDANTRVVEATLTANGLPVDLEGYTASVVFRKPDGTSGWYDMMPDGLSAVSIVGNTVTAMLAPQVLAVPGHVIAAIRIELDDDRATTFPFVIAVEADPSAGGEKSENYYNVTTWGELNNALDREIYPRLTDLDAKAVKTTPQDFNEEQKKIARNNIGAGTASVDNTAVGADAWSSKNIIDRLCPAFALSGPVVRCIPVEGYPLGVVSSIKLMQDGTPAWEDVTDSYVYYGLKENAVAYKGLTPGAPYKISVTNDAEISEIHAETASGDAIDGTVVLNGYTATLTFTLPEGFSDDVYIVASPGIYIIHELEELKSYPISGHSMVNLIVSNGAEENRYYADTMNTVYGGTYDWVNGVVTVDWVKIQITGGFTPSDGNAMQYIVPQKPFYNAAVVSCVCSHYPSFGWTNLYKIRNENGTHGVAMTSGASGNLVRLVDNVQFSGDVDALNTWLAENPIELAYKLAEPLTYQIEPQEIIALSGENTLVSNTGDTTVSGRADLIAHMDKLQQTVADQAEQIAELQAAAVNNI